MNYEGMIWGLFLSQLCLCIYCGYKFGKLKQEEKERERKLRNLLNKGVMTAAGSAKMAQEITVAREITEKSHPDWICYPNKGD